MLGDDCGPDDSAPSRCGLLGVTPPTGGAWRCRCTFGRVRRLDLRTGRQTCQGTAPIDPPVGPPPWTGSTFSAGPFASTNSSRACVARRSPSALSRHRRPIGQSRYHRSSRMPRQPTWRLGRPIVTLGSTSRTSAAHRSSNTRSQRCGRQPDGGQDCLIGRHRMIFGTTSRVS